MVRGQLCGAEFQVLIRRGVHQTRLMAIRRSYVYTSLTAAIADTGSPLRRHLDTQFPNKKALQNRYRPESRPLLVQGGDANPATLGAAFDFAVRFVLDPTHIPEVAIDAFRGSRRRARAILEVIDVAAAAADCRTTLAPESLLRAAWALALTTEVFRIGTWRHSPLRELGWLNFKPERLLRLAPPNALVQMQQLHDGPPSGEVNAIRRGDAHQKPAGSGTQPYRGGTSVPRGNRAFVRARRTR
jgi:hypothetical protein